MQVIARHERDDIDTELEPEQIAELEREWGVEIAMLRQAGITRVECLDGWHYRLNG